MTQTFSHRTPRSWLKISIDLPAALTDTVAGFLAELTGSGTEYADADPGRSRVTGYLAGEPAASGEALGRLRLFLDELQGVFPELEGAAVETSTLAEEDWNAQWKQHFRPFAISPRLVIKPTWEPFVWQGPDPAPMVIEMDPGLAFGTGHHESTRLVLRLVEELFSAGQPFPQRVLDVGTGTGILAMGCGLLGAGRVLALDNDPDAVAAAADNIRHNRLEQVVSAAHTPVEELAAAGETFSLVLANITHDVLTLLAPHLARLLAPGGTLVLAGLLAGEQVSSISATFQALGLKPIVQHTDGEWAGVALARPVES